MAFTKIGNDLTKEAFIGVALGKAARLVGSKLLPQANKAKNLINSRAKTLGGKLKPLVYTSKQEAAKNYSMPRTLGKTMSGVGTPLSLGFMAYDTAAGNSSAGQAVAGGAAGVAGYNIGSKIPGLRRLGSAGRLAGGLIGSTLGYEAGSRLGNKVPPTPRVSPYQNRLENVGVDTSKLSV